MESACEAYNSRYLCAGYPYDEGRQTVKLVQVNYPDGEVYSCFVEAHVVFLFSTVQYCIMQTGKTRYTSVE